MSPQRRPSGGSGAGRGRGRGEYARKYTPRRKVCAFCVDKISYIDYKDVPRLRRYLSERGKIEPRRKTGTCAKHQRALAVALKRARHVALMPYTAEHIRLSGMVMRSPDDRRRGDDRGPRGGFGRPAAAPAPAVEATAPASTGPDGAATGPDAVAATGPDGAALPAEPGAPAAATAMTEGDAVAAVPAGAPTATTGAPAASETITPTSDDAAVPAEGAAVPPSPEGPRAVTAGD